ncbi:MAG: hypothetical protein AAGE96_17000 [Cyanobacteria bacterium P01_G01_bin.19]
MAMCVMTSGIKGGTGKTIVCRTVAAYFLEKQIEFTLIEADRSNPDCYRALASEINCHFAIFSEKEAHEDSANEIYNLSINTHTLVNLPAQIEQPFYDFFFKNELLEIAPIDGVSFLILWVSDGGYDSLKLFRKSLEMLPIPHVFIKNFGRTEDWTVMEDKELQQLIKDKKVKVIDFPRFIGRKTLNDIDSSSLSFTQALTHKSFTSIEKQRVRRFLRDSATQFDKVFTHLHQPLKA